MTSSQDIVRYYQGETHDGGGRLLSEVQNWPDESLERVHDFIQWMFPLKERSMFSPAAPVLDDRTVSAFKSSPSLRANLLVSFERMLRFYGLELVHTPSLQIKRSSAFAQRSGEWITPGNHNHLRITRILRSLTLLGLAEEANAFFECLSDIYKSQDKQRLPISEETLEFWRAAVSKSVD